MIKLNNFTTNGRVPTVLKINPGKLRELLPAFELNKLSNSITIFVKLEQLKATEKIVYAEKSEYETAFERFQEQGY